MRRFVNREPFAALSCSPIPFIIPPRAHWKQSGAKARAINGKVSLATSKISGSEVKNEDNDPLKRKIKIPIPTLSIKEIFYPITLYS
jgi:hypothetical protein